MVIVLNILDALLIILCVHIFVHSNRTLLLLFVHFAFTSPAQRPAVSALKDELAESDLPFLVDLHIWDEVPERFHEIIRKEYVVLQEAPFSSPPSAQQPAIKANLRV